MKKKPDKSCAGCDATGLTFLFSLGSMPPVNAFVTESEVPREKAYPLDLYFCPSCTLVQLGDVVPPGELFSHYLHLSSGSQTNVDHLKGVADLVFKRCRLSEKSRVLELGSNDGTLLSFLRTKVTEVLGVDPAKNLAPLAKEKGVDTISTFFSEKVGTEIAGKRGTFDAVVALNVVAHTPDFVSLLKGVKKILSPEGTFMMEAAYVVETILNGQFDTIYHEHVYCFSLHAISAALKRVGMRVVDVEVIPTQGTSIRVFAKHENEDPKPAETVAKLLAEEKKKGFTDSAVFASAARKVEQFKSDLRKRLAALKAKHGDVIGLGAPARGVVILNYCGIDPNELKFVIDDTPLKQGRMVPGVHIPVKGWEALGSKKPTAYLLLSWNYRDFLVKKLKSHVDKAVVLLPFPELTEIEI